MEDQNSDTISVDFLIDNGYIDVFDEDNDTTFTLFIYEGENYNIIDNVIVPDEHYYGDLLVPIQVDDEHAPSLQMGGHGLHQLAIGIRLASQFPIQVDASQGLRG